MKRAAAAALAVTLALTLTACSDDQTDENPCGKTGSPGAGDFSGARQALIVPAKGGGSSGGGGRGGGTSGGAKSSSSGAKGSSSGSSGGTASSRAAAGFAGAKSTGSHTFTTADGRKMAVAPRTAPPPYAPPRPYTASSGPVYVATGPQMSPYLWWALYGNYPGATTIIECR